MWGIDDGHLNCMKEKKHPRVYSSEKLATYLYTGSSRVMLDLFYTFIGLSESQPSVESLIGLSFKSLDDDNCLYCPICRLSFFNIHGKQSHFCGRPHVMELVTRLEDIERKRKEGWVLETCDEELLFGRPDLRGVPVDEHTRNRFISETQKSVGLNEGNIHRKDNVTVSEKRNKQCDEDVRLLLRKKLLETNPHLGNNCHDTRIGQESKNEPSSHT